MADHPVTLKLYNTASPANALDKSLGTAVTASDLVLPPSFDAQSGDVVRFTLNAAGRDWNYAELTGAPFNEAASRTWYYFIDKLDHLGGTDGGNDGGYVAHLRIDPLMTYKSTVRSVSLYVSRNEVDYDKSIPDAQLSQHYYPTIEKFYGDTNVANPSSPSIIVETVSAIGMFVNIMSPENFKKFCDKFWDLDLTQLLYDPKDCITRCFMLPYEPSTLARVYGIPSQTVIPVGIGALNPDGYTGYGANIEFVPSKVINTLSIELPRSGDDWRNKDDHYRLYFPYCGFIDMAATDLYNTSNESQIKSVYVDYVLDLVTGEVIAEVNSDISTISKLHYLPGNMAIPIPFSSSNTAQRFVGGITGLITTAAGIAASEIASPIVGAGMVAGGISQMLSSTRASTSISGVVGSTTSWGLPQRLYGHYHHNNFSNYGADFARIYGKPLYQNRAGSALTGFTICENVHIQPNNCPATIAAELKRLRESGVYFDNGL